MESRGHPTKTSAMPSSSSSSPSGEEGRIFTLKNFERLLHNNESKYGRTNSLFAADLLATFTHLEGRPAPQPGSNRSISVDFVARIPCSYTQEDRIKTELVLFEKTLALPWGAVSGTYVSDVPFRIKLIQCLVAQCERDILEFRPWSDCANLPCKRQFHKMHGLSCTLTPYEPDSDRITLSTTMVPICRDPRCALRFTQFFERSARQVASKQQQQKSLSLSAEPKQPTRAAMDPTRAFHVCAFCGRCEDQTQSFRKCPKCKVTFYCGQRCESKDRQHHRMSCCYMPKAA